MDSTWSDETVANDFLQRFAADHAAGRKRSLADYLELFPDHGEVVAREFLALEAERSADPSMGISGYRIEEEIGRGGQAVVYRAIDEELKRPVALKLIHAGSSLSGAALERFRREAEITARLDHPGICPVYDAGTDRGRAYIAMRLIEGERLDRALAVGPAPSHTAEFDRIATLGEAIARALHVAHEAGVIHRDVKPSNVMLDGAGNPVVMDFGIAADTDSELPTLTRTDDMMGTPAYMSPEQIARSVGPVDRRADVYALGVTLYECLARRRPFEAPTRDGLYRMILTGHAPPVADANPHVPPDLAVIVHTAFDRDPGRRYQTALALAQDLRRWRAREPIHARPAPVRLKVARWAQRNPAVATLLGALVLSLTLGFAWSARSNVRLAREKARVDHEKERAQRALDDVRRLSDGRRLRRLLADQAELWPPHPDLVDQLSSWLSDARGLVADNGQRRALLEEVRGRARAADDVERRRSDPAAWSDLDRLRRRADALSKLGSGEPDERLEGELEELDERIEASERALRSVPIFHFGSEDDAWLAELLAELVSAVDQIARAETGVIAQVERRLDRARRIRRETIEECADRWGVARRDVAADPRFDGLVLEPLLGFVPLGADPESGLQEFLHWPSHQGAMLARDADGRLARTADTGLVLVLVPGGRFAIGAQNREPGAPRYDPAAERFEMPIQQLELAPFLISKYEMTRGQWRRIADGDLHLQPPPDAAAASGQADLLPAADVSWPDCAEITRRAGLALPTEAQWERAARADTDTPWYTGEDAVSLQGHANVADVAAGRYPPSLEFPFERRLDDGYVAQAPVGSLRPNSFGLHDVHGNLMEWCLDGFDYHVRPVLPGTGERIAREGRNRMIRGGCYIDLAVRVRSAYRLANPPETRLRFLGLRPVFSLEP